MRVLGHEFTPMTHHDWDAFAGANEGSLIAYISEEVTLIYDPATGTLSEIGPDWQRDWTSLEL